MLSSRQTKRKNEDIIGKMNSFWHRLYRYRKKERNYQNSLNDGTVWFPNASGYYKVYGKLSIYQKTDFQFLKLQSLQNAKILEG